MKYYITSFKIYSPYFHFWQYEGKQEQYCYSGLGMNPTWKRRKGFSVQSKSRNCWQNQKGLFTYLFICLFSNYLRICKVVHQETTQQNNRYPIGLPLLYDQNYCKGTKRYFSESMFHERMPRKYRTKEITFHYLLDKNFQKQ